MATTANGSKPGEPSIVRPNGSENGPETIYQPEYSIGTRSIPMAAESYARKTYPPVIDDPSVSSRRRASILEAMPARTLRISRKGAAFRRSCDTLGAGFPQRPESFLPRQPRFVCTVAQLKSALAALRALPPLWVSQFPNRSTALRRFRPEAKRIITSGGTFEEVIALATRRGIRGVTKTELKKLLAPRRKKAGVSSTPKRRPKKVSPEPPAGQPGKSA